MIVMHTPSLAACTHTTPGRWQQIVGPKTSRLCRRQLAAFPDSKVVQHAPVLKQRHNG
jgi:hypothetical protein